MKHYCNQRFCQKKILYKKCVLLKLHKIFRCFTIFAMSEQEQEQTPEVILDMHQHLYFLRTNFTNFS